jgi:sigma-B regulation protein RsbU (phosphoserine phosphatase)
VHWDIIQQNSYSAIRGKYRYMDFVRITYTDNGIGFDNQYSDYIFRLFKKINTDSEGIGFGLALAKKIVEFHHGSISAQGNRGVGATFTILLPLTR